MMFAAGRVFLPIVVLIPGGVAAQPAASPVPPQITVTGNGSVQTPPDIAVLAFNVRGEGDTAAVAAKAMLAKREAIGDAMRASNPQVEVRNGAFNFREVRDKECTRERYDAPRLSTGACAVVGYIAELGATVRMAPATAAGTVLTAASRAGATDGRLDRFELRDPAGARRNAVAAALADAQSRAAAIAVASGKLLGPLVSVLDGQSRRGPQYDEIVVSSARAVPSPPPPAPIVVAIAPVPIITSEQLVVTYGILPGSAR